MESCDGEGCDGEPDVIKRYGELGVMESWV